MNFDPRIPVVVDDTPQVIRSDGRSDPGTSGQPVLTVAPAACYYWFGRWRRRMTLSMEEEAVANLDFCESVVGGPTSTFLRSAEIIVDCAGEFTVGVSSPGRPCWKRHCWCVVSGRPCWRHHPYKLKLSISHISYKQTGNILTYHTVRIPWSVIRTADVVIMLTLLFNKNNP